MIAKVHLEKAAVGGVLVVSNRELHVVVGPDAELWGGIRTGAYDGGRERDKPLGVSDRPLYMKRLALVALAGCVIGCRDARKTAVEEVIRFSEAAPFSIGKPHRPYAGYAVVVDDSALARYNQIFRYFDPKDSSRTHTYRELPGVLFWSLPVTSVTRLSVKEATPDTLVATVVFERPEQRNFNDRFGSIVLSGDSLPPTPAKITEFDSALARIRNELKESDTAVFRVVSGPYIVSIRTASGVRDSIMRDSIVRVARTHLERLVREAEFENIEVADYSRLRTYAAGLGGGAVNGEVRPGSVGWYKDERVLSDVRVQCEARRGEQSTIEDGYVNVEEGTKAGSREFLCLWHGDEARDWERIRPTGFRVRLVAYAASDSTVGPWKSTRE